MERKMTDKSRGVQPGGDSAESSISSPFDEEIRKLLEQLATLRPAAALLGLLVICVFLYILIDATSSFARSDISNSVIAIVSITSPIVGLTIITSTFLVAVFRGTKEQDAQRDALNALARTSATHMQQ